MQDFSGREIVRPRCPHCRVEMKWDGNGVYSNESAYVCLTEGCEHYRMTEQQIIDYVVPCKRGASSLSVEG